jgi:hypothetical protein
MCLQDSANTQTGLYVEVLVPWPSSPEHGAQLRALLLSHAGRSLAVTVALPRRPALGWLDGPDAMAMSLSSPISWRCALVHPVPVRRSEHTLRAQSSCKCFPTACVLPPEETALSDLVAIAKSNILAAWQDIGRVCAVAASHIKH